MASGRMVDYLGQGLAASRPASLSLTTGAAGVYYATDTDSVSFWDGTAWGPWIGSTAAATIPIGIACSDETTALTTGAAKVTFRMPFGFTLTAVRASVTTAPTGSVLTVDINRNGASILSTKITIDAGEKSSASAATQPVLTVAALSDDDEITVDIDTVGSTVAGAGLKVYLVGSPS